MGRNVTLGSVSHGTMRDEDLIPSFAWELKHNTPDGATRFAKLLEECEAWEAAETDDSEEEPEDGEQGSSDLVDALFEALNEYAPDGCYFGAHHGDGADFGFWISESFFEDFDGLKVSDTSEVPDDYEGAVLHVNDHGNATLYTAHAGQLTEVWSVV